MSTRTLSEMKSHVLTKAVEDEDFRAQLIEDPKGVISDELGISIPEGFRIHVHEESPTTAHLILPRSDSLSEQELELVAGGVDVYHV